ncbi:hypothetical protein OAK04_00985 [Verrucomicrobia bacterium]|nr:hypothetical protein [Verrucomicrobiota bacterium]
MSEIDWANLTEQDLERIEKLTPVFAKKIKEEGGIEKWNGKWKFQKKEVEWKPSEEEIEKAKQEAEKHLADRRKNWKKYLKGDYAKRFQQILDDEAKNKSG